MSEMKFRVFIVNEDNYNKACDENRSVFGGKPHDFREFGDWFDFPIDNSEIGKVISERIGASSRYGYTICDTDIETGIHAVDDYSYIGDPIWQTNNDAYEVTKQKLDSDGEYIIDALVGSGEYTLHEAVDCFEDFYLFNSGSWYELGREIAEDSDVAVDGDLVDYVDWESYAKDTTCEVHFRGDRCVVKF